MKQAGSAGVVVLKAVSLTSKSAQGFNPGY
mgnify:CR=1 FL=1